MDSIEVRTRSETLLQNGSPTDRELVELLSSDPEKAGTMLWERYRGYVYTICKERFESVSDAEDAAQECWLKIWDKIQHLTPNNDCLRPWICRVAKNHCEDILRKKRSARRGFTEEEEEEFAEELYGGSTVRTNSMGSSNGFDYVLQTEMGRQLAEITECIALQEYTMRHMLHLLFIEELSLEQIEDAIGIKLGTIKSRIHRFREFLRKTFPEAAHLLS